MSLQVKREVTWERLGRQRWIARVWQPGEREEQEALARRSIVLENSISAYLTIDVGLASQSANAQCPCCGHAHSGPFGGGLGGVFGGLGL